MGHGAQSRSHVWHVSGPSHVPSPQTGSQSAGQFAYTSPGSQYPFPHKLHDPQSIGQSPHDSLLLQTPSPQYDETHGPQSLGHELHDSLTSHVPSPHVTIGGHEPQSPEHDIQSSFPVHCPSPHTSGHVGQSAPHV